MGTAVLILFIFLLFLVFLYSLAQLNLLYHYLKKGNSEEISEKFDFSNPGEIPFVTIQLPVYNEINVVERLLRNIAEIEYPQGKLEIQVLDDSTDDSVQFISELISELNRNGKNFIHLHRKDRKGFKAGALKEGLETAKGEFIAIFDADFLPEKDWLQKTIPYFKDEKIGVVQTRWGHLNRNFSLLTKIQAFALDYHFILEQNGRSSGNHFINFNGTAGIWRKKCILDSGNWHGNTLTEDLDLSYRAQLKNWKFKYLENVETPAELPITLAAARSQQFRWNKGAAENFQKNFKKVLFDQKIGFGTKIHGFFHLLNSSLFLIILLLAILSVPVLFLLNSRDGDYFLYIISFFSISSLIFFLCYWVTFSQEKTATKTSSFLKFLPRTISFFSIAMGFSVHNSLAVLEGHIGKKSEFIRTPKFNITDNSKAKHPKMTFSKEIPGTFFIELILLAYFGFGIYSAFMLNNFSMIIFHIMLFSGFGFVVIKSLNFSIPFKSKKDLAGF